MNRRAWIVHGCGILVTLVEGDQVFIALAGFDYEELNIRFPEVDS